MEWKAMLTEVGTEREWGCRASWKAVLNRHPRFGTALGHPLLCGAGRIALVVVMAIAMVLCGIRLGVAQLADSPWPMRGHDARHTGQSPYKGIDKPKLRWKFQTGHRVDSSPAIGSDGTVYVGSLDNNLYALNPDGSLKWKFLTGERVYYSSPAIDSDGTIYVGSIDRPQPR